MDIKNINNSSLAYFVDVASNAPHVSIWRMVPLVKLDPRRKYYNLQINYCRTSEVTFSLPFGGWAKIYQRSRR